MSHHVSTSCEALYGIGFTFLIDFLLAGGSAKDFVDFPELKESDCWDCLSLSDFVELRSDWG